MNVGLLDARGTGSIFYSLRQKFTAVEFFDLCSVIEEFVLREKVVIVGKYNNLPRALKDPLIPFVRAGIIEINWQPTQILNVPDPTPQLLSLALKAERDGLYSSTLIDAKYEVTRVLGAEIDLKLPTTPLLRNLMYFGVSRRPHVDHAVCDLKGQYDKLSGNLDNVRWNFSKSAGIKYLSVPPIALECLQRANSFDQLCERILDARDNYAHLRNMMVELSNILSDPNINLEKYVKVVGRWEDRWRKMTEPSSFTLGWGVSAQTLLVQGAKITAALKTGHYRSLIEPLFKAFQHCFSEKEERLFRPLHTSVQNYLRSSGDEIAQSISNVFDIAPSIAATQMSAVACADTSLWRAACANVRQQHVA